MSDLVEEVAAAISINQINYAVMMITPDDIKDFITGFLFTEQIIEQAYDIHDWQIDSHELGLNIDVTLANRCMYKFASKKRALRGTSGCGICGTQALEQAFPALTALPACKPYRINNAPQLKNHLTAHQLKAQQSGALHAAFWLDSNNQILACREDIGRHNALDKLIGYIQQVPVKPETLAKQALLVTSRCSTELIQKAVKVGIPTLISLASPSQLAVKLAKQYGLNLIHIPRQDEPNYYYACQTAHLPMAKQFQQNPRAAL